MTDAPRDLALILERVELALPELFPGFQTEERRVALDGVLVADLLGRAGARTLLVSLVGEDEAATALRALDGLSFARTQRELLAAYLPGETFTGPGPQVVLVGEGFSARLRARLAPLLEQGDLCLVTRHELSTARGSLTRLRLELQVAPEEPPVPSQELPDWAMQPPLRDFLARVAPDRLPLALQLVERVQRIDPGLSWVSGAGSSLLCTLGEQPLCALAWLEGHLELSLGEGTVPHAIRDEAAIDFVLDWVLTCFLELVEEARMQAQEPAVATSEPVEVTPVAPATAPRAPEERSEERPSAQGAPPGAGEERLEELEEFELRPAPPPPLLSREELEAFLD
jgi:hypothetical protein